MWQLYETKITLKMQMSHAEKNLELGERRMQ